jgi:hypothetical protein
MSSLNLRTITQLNLPTLQIKVIGEEVKASKQKFNSGPEKMRLNGVLEEAYVLALERSIIPHPGALTPKQAFDKALMKVCTSITSGWFREYAWENYYEVQKLYNPGYVDLFNLKRKEGIVKCL